ncbi:MAG: hypothetical protein JWO87_3203 [Phycisphaerales bacterium]|nr:hypothetical protein [Phycisphaerales bacterium]
MSISDTVARKVEQLPPERQLEVLDFVEFLERKPAKAGARRDPEGLLADQPSNLGLEEFAEARREMWREFPREMGA